MRAQTGVMPADLITFLHLAVSPAIAGFPYRPTGRFDMRFIPKPIALIDGAELTRLMVQHNVGREQAQRRT